MLKRGLHLLLVMREKEKKERKKERKKDYAPNIYPTI
jgi:hypothetical protein